jgi:drug/metabolite transporter (DMT)-like permease
VHGPAVRAASAIYNTLLKRWELQLPLLVSMWVQALAASVLLLPFYLLADKHALTPVSSGLILYAAGRRADAGRRPDC